MSADLADSAARTLPVASQRLAVVVENVAIARDTYRLRLEDPVLARSILPGQFVMIRPAADGADDPLLGRPFALYDVVTDTGGTPIAIDIVYLVVGRGTAALARRRPADELSVWGPLGNGFGPAPGGSVLFVAGGIGQTPFLALGRWWLGKMSYGTPARDLASPCSFSFSGSTSTAEPHRCSSATLLYGVRTAELLAGLKDFRQVDIDVEIATDDGSAGHHGYVTDLLAGRLQRGDRPAGSLAADHSRCSRPWPVWWNLTKFLATSRSRITWRVALASVSVVSLRSASPTVPRIFAGCAWKGQSSQRPGLRGVAESGEL